MSRCRARAFLPSRPGRSTAAPYVLVVSEKDHLTEAAEALAVHPREFGDMHPLTLREGLQMVDPIFKSHYEASGRAKEASRVAEVVTALRERAEASRREASATDTSFGTGDGREREISEARASAYESAAEVLEQTMSPVDLHSFPRWALFSRECSIRNHAGCSGKAPPPAGDHDCTCSCHSTATEGRG